MNSLSKYPSFVSPGRIRTLVVPIGKWKQNQFIEAVNRIKDYSEIRLLDITPIDSPLFTPQGFPNGRLFFDFDFTSNNDSLELFLYDFQPFRKTFIVIGLVNDDSPIEQNLQVLKEKYQTVISMNLIYYNNENPKIIDSQLPNVFHTNLSLKPNNLETIICDIGHNFLEALSHYYSSYKHVTLRSPGAIGGNSISKAIITRYGPNNTLVNPTDIQKPSSNSSKRLSSFEMTTNSIKRSASLKLANTLSTSDSRTQQKSRGRQLKIIGNFQLLAGRYSDALTSFTESVTLLYKLRDFLWLGSAIDGIAICFISLNYLNIPFQVPEIIHLLCPLQTVDQLSSITTTSTTENSKTNVHSSQITSTSTKSIPRTSISAIPQNLQSPRNSTNITASFLDVDISTINLPHLIRKMAEKILYYYELTLTSNNEYVPNIVYCDFVLKTLSFMVACHNEPTLSPEILDSIMHEDLPKFHVKCKRLDDNDMEFSSEDIYVFATKLFELQLDTLSIELQVNIYMTLAKTYKVLGFQRKEAFTLKLLLKSLETFGENLFWSKNHREIIHEILKTYGITRRRPELNIPDSKDVSWFILQKRALNLCVSLAKKVNDIELMAELSIKLLTNFTHILNASEQNILFKEFIQPCITNGSIKKYWDPFVIRNCSIQRLEFDEPGTQSAKLPVEMSIKDIDKSPLRDTKAQIKTDEVFNPFKISTTKKVKFAPEIVNDNILLVGDKAEFTCTLQNPFKFDLHITELQFGSELSKHCELKDEYFTKSNPYIIKPESFKDITLQIVLKKSTFSDGCLIDCLSLSAFDLPNQEFKIVNSEQHTASVKTSVKEYHTSSDNVTDINASVNERSNYGSLDLKIFPEQPQLQITNKSNIAENSLMILDGTKTKIILNIRNKSLSCPIDFMSFHTISNIERDLKNDYWKKYQPDELYAVEKQLKMLKDSAITINNAPKKMKPGENISLEMEVDVTNAPFTFSEFNLVIKYGMNVENSENVYVKELEVPYEVTIQKTIEVANLDVIPLNEEITTDNTSVDWIKYVQAKLNSHSGKNIHDFVLLLLDFRNSWLDGLNLQVQFDDFESKKYLIETGHTLRMIIPIQKIEFEKKGFGNKQIPRVVAGRQFIQSSLKTEEEAELREQFWCREYILDRLKCRWNFFHDGDSNGYIDCRKFLEKFDSKMVSTLYKGKSLFTVKLHTDNTTVNIGDDLKLGVHLENTRTKITDDIPPQRKLNIWIIDHKTSKILPRSNSRILYNGTFSRMISTDKPFSTEFNLLPVEPGTYEICAAVARLESQDPLLHFDSESIIITVK